MEKYHVYQDPAHGWLKVPIVDLALLGIADQITSYSYVHGAYVYLEEDCDMTTYLRARFGEDRETMKIWLASVKTSYAQYASRIRNYDRYPAHHAPMSIQDYETKVQALEKEGMTRSDAQGVVDIEEMKTVSF